MGRRAALGLLITGLALTGCTKARSKRCVSVWGDHSCTFKYKSWDDLWYERLESSYSDAQAVVNGTVTVESGSGTMRIEGLVVEFEWTTS